MASRLNPPLPLSEVAITGIGLVSPIGVGRDEVVRSLVAGRSGVTLGDENVGPWDLRAYVPDDFDPKKFVTARKSLKVMSHETQLGVSAAAIAMNDAGWSPGSIEPRRLAVILGTDIMHCLPAELIPTYLGCEVDGEFQFGIWAERAQKELNPLWMLKYLPNMAASHIAIAHDAQGPSNSLVLGDVSGLLAIAEGASLITRGWADVVIAGGAGSLRNPTTRMYHGFDHLSRDTRLPIQTPRPFDANRDGTVAGEGAGIVVLERRSNAQARNARIYGTLAGVGQGMMHRPTAEQPQALESALTKALNAAQWTPESIDHINASGRASITDDRREALACAKVLPSTPVSAPSSYFGYLGAAGGAVELIVSIIMMNENQRPRTLNSQSAAADCPIPLQTELAPLRTKRMIKLSQAWTGQAVAIAFESASED